MSTLSFASAFAFFFSATAFFAYCLLFFFLRLSLRLSLFCLLLKVAELWHKVELSSSKYGLLFSFASAFASALFHYGVGQPPEFTKA
jgi:hypothetical protein